MAPSRDAKWQEWEMQHRYIETMQVIMTRLLESREQSYEAFGIFGDTQISMGNLPSTHYYLTKALKNQSFFYIWKTLRHQKKYMSTMHITSTIPYLRSYIYGHFFFESSRWTHRQYLFFYSSRFIIFTNSCSSFKLSPCRSPLHLTISFRFEPPHSLLLSPSQVKEAIVPDVES